MNRTIPIPRLMGAATPSRLNRNSSLTDAHHDALRPRTRWSVAGPGTRAPRSTAPSANSRQQRDDKASPLRLEKLGVALLSLWIVLAAPARAASNALLCWNNLGMHCMDSDYSVFSILPPYNTIEAQLIVGGKLVTNGSGYTVTYQAVADPGRLVQLHRHGQGQFLHLRRRRSTAPRCRRNGGLAGWAMPGTNNTPQGHAVRADQPSRRRAWPPA